MVKFNIEVELVVDFDLSCIQTECIERCKELFETVRKRKQLGIVTST